MNCYLSDSWKKSVKFNIKIPGICNIGLKKGEDQFNPTLDILKNFEGMLDLQWRSDLIIEIPDKISEWTKRENITKILSEVEKTGKYKQIGFHYDFGIKNALLSVILQIVDDSPFRGNRRTNIMNSSYEYIGISCKEINGNICYYFVFAS